MQPHEALFTRSQAAVLALFFTNPRRRYFFNQLVRHAHVGRGAVQREVLRLQEAGLILRVREGRRLYYQANPESPVFVDLTGLIQKTTGPVGQLNLALQPHREKIDIAFIYGSIAAGSETLESDVDLMVIGSMDFGEVVSATSPLTDRLLREINPSVFPRDEFQRKLKEGNSFLRRVMKGPKLFVIGDENVLGRLAQG